MTAKTGVEYFGTVCVAMVTPFDANDRVDLDQARALAARLVDDGCDSLVLSGTTGESPTTSVEEKLSLLTAVKDEVGDRARIIAGSGTNYTAPSVELAKANAEAGADGLLVVTPYYSRPSQAGVVKHVSAIAEATPLPICLYDIPGRSALALAPETIRTLAKLPTVKALKDAKGNFKEATPLIEETGLAWYSGDDPSNLPWLALGASGGISVIGHVAASQLRALYRAVDEGNLAEARAINAKIHPLVEAQGRLGGTSFAKAALQLQGVEVGPPRLPIVEPTDEELEGLRRDMQKAGVL